MAKVMKDNKLVDVADDNLYIPPTKPSTNPADYALSNAQFKALVMFLNVDGKIRTAIEQIPDALQRAWVMSRYENSSTYRFLDPTVQSLREAIAMSKAELSSAWLQAKDLKSE